MAVTTIEELKAKKYIEISLPGWDTDDTFKVRLQRVNILDLASKGKIPNPLMGPVIELFKGKGPEPDSTEGLKLLNELSELFAEVTMVEPTYSEVKEAIGLTDEQKMIIYNFAIEGARAIEPFREKLSNNRINKHGTDVPEASQRDNENK